MKTKILLLLPLLMLLMSTCKKDKIKGDWCIPKNEVKDGGPGKDGIPALACPSMISSSSASYLSDDDLVLGFVNGSFINSKASVYPMVETTWKTWKLMFPSTKVASTSTGHNRSYGILIKNNKRCPI